MYIGYMGTIPFIVSEDYLRTPSDVQRSGSGRWHEHSLILKKPVQEFGGPNLEQIQFNIQLIKSYGMNPTKELESLRQYRDNGVAFPLVIGGKPVSQTYWVLTDMSEGDMYFDAYGKLISVTASLTLKEYPDDNYTEQQSLLNKYGTALNVVSTLF